MQRCNLPFIDEWAHRWDFHPDSSNHHWTSGPGPLAFLKAASKIMPFEKDPDLIDLDAQAENLETEKIWTDISVTNMETHTEPSDPASGKESVKEYSEIDTGLRQVIEPASKDNKDSENVKLVRVLEFIPARKPE